MGFCNAPVSFEVSAKCALHSFDCGCCDFSMQPVASDILMLLIRKISQHVPSRVSSRVRRRSRLQLVGLGRWKLDDHSKVSQQANSMF
jgi:hypothetical protein